MTKTATVQYFRGRELPSSSPETELWGREARQQLYALDLTRKSLHATWQHLAATSALQKEASNRKFRLSGVTVSFQEKRLDDNNH